MKPQGSMLYAIPRGVGLNECDEFPLDQARCIRRELAKKETLEEELRDAEKRFAEHATPLPNEKLIIGVAVGGRLHTRLYAPGPAIIRPWPKRKQRD